MAVIVFLRGGGDLASGVALRLHRAGLPVLVTELPQPMVVRRRVAFAEAVYQGEVVIEGVRGRRVQSLEQAVACTGQGMVAVQVDPEAAGLEGLKARFTAVILVDARMTKRPPETGMEVASLVIGLGPGFTAGQNCHAVVETNRGHAMGRVIWQGSAEKDTGVPERVDRWTSERVLRAPRDGVLHTLAEIGE